MRNVFIVVAFACLVVLSGCRYNPFNKCKSCPPLLPQVAPCDPCAAVQ